MKCPDCGFEDEYWECDKCAVLEEEVEKLKKAVEMWRKKYAEIAFENNKVNINVVSHNQTGGITTTKHEYPVKNEGGEQ